MIDRAPMGDEITVKSIPWLQWFNNLFSNLRTINVKELSTFNDVDIEGALTIAGASTITETLNFNAVLSGEVETLTVINGAITGRTLKA